MIVAEYSYHSLLSSRLRVSGSTVSLWHVERLQKSNDQLETIAYGVANYGAASYGPGSLRSDLRRRSSCCSDLLWM